MSKTIEQIQLEFDEMEKRGVSNLAAYPELWENATALAANRARRYRADVGDISGDAMSSAIESLIRAASFGIPTGEDERAVWFTNTINRAVDRERDRARARWAPRRREAAPSDAPNTMEHWSADKLIRHAEQFTNGRLTTAIQARAIIDGRAESPTVAPKRRMIVTRQGGSTFIYGTPRTAAPSAENDYLRGFAAAMLRGWIDGNSVLLAASDAYRGERRRIRKGDPLVPVGTITRKRYVAWKAATLALGASADIRRTVESLAKRYGKAAPSLAAIPRSMCGSPIPFAASMAPWAVRWAVRVPTAIFSPTVPTVLRASAPTVSGERSYFRPIPTGAGLYPAALATAYVPTGWAGLTGDARTIGTYAVEDERPTLFYLNRLAIWFAVNARREANPTVRRAAPIVTGCETCKGASAHPVTCERSRDEWAAMNAAHRAASARTWAARVFQFAGMAPWADLARCTVTTL